MPELPELQALAERLETALQGRSLERLDVLGFSGLKTVEPSPDSLVGRSLAGVGRRGKYLIFDFGGERAVIHLAQGGRVELEEPPKTTRPKGVVARLTFEGAALLLKEFGTERRAALWLLGPEDEGPMAGLGPEPDTEEFKELVRAAEDGRRLHTWLRDQRTMAGIGRGFADDILHEARLSPYATVRSLDEEARERLVAATARVLDAALERERERTGGLPAKLEGRFAVHGHWGEPCPRCGTEMKRVSFESKEITYCPDCQTNGRVLADRRLSRLLK